MQTLALPKSVFMSDMNLPPALSHLAYLIKKENECRPSGAPTDSGLQKEGGRGWNAAPR